MADNQRLSSQLTERINSVLQAFPDSINSQKKQNLEQTLSKYPSQFQTILQSHVPPILFQTLLQGIDQYISLLHRHTAKWNERFNSEDEIDLTILQGKFDYILQCLTGILYQKEDDLYGLEATHPRWQAIEAITSRESLGDPADITAKFDKFMMQLILNTAAFRQLMKDQNAKTPGFFKVAATAAKLSKQPEKAKRQAWLSLINPDMWRFKAQMNMTNDGVGEMIIRLTSESVRLMENIYLPRPSPMVLDIQPNDLSAMKFEKNQKLSHKKINNSVRVVAFSQSDIPAIQTRTGFYNQIQYNLSSKPTETQNAKDKLILHFHGSAYIVMNPESHQNYLRKWAHITDAPIFSVDYRLTPEHPFPAALDDAWQSYVWLIENSQQQLGIDPKNVVLVGDSAGGNLALSLALRSIQLGYRVPDGLLLIYPWLHLTLNKYSPSQLQALECDYLGTSGLFKAMQLYFPEQSLYKKYEELINPLTADIDLLKKLPTTRILVGNRDQLVDDSYRIADRLLQAGVNTSLVDFDKVPHGALVFDVKGGVRECNKFVQRAGGILKKLLLRH